MGFMTRADVKDEVRQVFNIGLTGGIGSGKSTVAGWFREQGVPVLDADKTAHRLLEADASTIERLIREFSPGILGEQGNIHRGKLGAIVFNDRNARKRLERIIHPRIRSSMEEQRALLLEAGERICVWDVPLLLETGYDEYTDEIWVVWVPRELQISRVLARDGLSLAEIEARLAAQWPLEEKRKRADVVVDNSGSPEDLARRLEQLWKTTKDRFIEFTN